MGLKPLLVTGNRTVSLNGSVVIVNSFYSLECSASMDNKIILGSDHGGFELKEIVKTVLMQKSYQVRDVGCFSPNSVNYPDIARQVTDSIISGEFTKGILICGTGIGMSIAANRRKTIRATLCHDHLGARMSREHNDSNILVLGGRTIGIETARDILETWLTTEFTGGRHQRRLETLDA